jgi:hypothetical protein
MNIPIVTVQKNDADCLLYCLAQAKSTNPTSEIYLIGDKQNDLYKFINCHYIHDYETEAKIFEKYYKHLDSNTYEFGLICFQRWFVLKEFMKKNNYNSLLHIDPDVMLYKDISQEENFANCDLALSGDANEGLLACGHSCFINNFKVLEELCDFIMQHYKDETKFKEIEEIYRKLNENNNISGISDMVLLKKFIQTNKFKIIHNGMIINNSIYDDNFNCPGEYEASGNTKYIFMQNKKPYGIHSGTKETIAFNSLHFQGATKPLMKRFYTGNKAFLIFNKFMINLIKKTRFLRWKSK